MNLMERVWGKAYNPTQKHGAASWLDLRWNLLRLKALAGVAATPKHLSGRHA